MTAPQKPTRKALPQARRLSVTRFKRSEDGATVVEFALVAVPFFALVFAIIELSLIFFGTQMLETAVADSARLVLTGQQQEEDKKLKPNGQPKDDNDKRLAFKKTLCDDTLPPPDRPMLTYLFDCNKLKVDVFAYEKTKCFAGLDMGAPMKDGKIDMSTFEERYVPGGASAIVVVRVIYPWDTSVITWPLNALNAITMNFSNMSNNRRLLIATTAFRNEPFLPGSAPAKCT